MFYLPNLIKKKVKVETEVGEIEGVVIHISNVIILINEKKPIIVRSWSVIKWYR